MHPIVRNDWSKCGVSQHTPAAPQNALLQYVLNAVPQPAVPPPAAVAALGSAAAASGSRYSKAQALGPHCGDGVCQAGESCATCAYDCKQVTADGLRLPACWTVRDVLFCLNASLVYAPSVFHLRALS